jgi:hypothetical protein
MWHINQRWIVAALLGLAHVGLGLTTGCGGGAAQLGVLADPTKSSYVASCGERASKERDLLASGAYVPAQFHAHLWPTQGETVVTEARLAAALAAGDVKRVVVQARGGLGKSSLAASLRGQLCGAMPVFLVDLKDVAQVGEAAAGRILAVAAKDAGITDARTLAQDLKGKRFVVMLDAIEEVELTRRSGLLADMTALSEQLPQVQIVLLERPPVLDADYGFARPDAVLEMPPLDCKASEAAIARSFPGDAERARFSEFLHRHGLDERARFGMQCVFPYLATYRDISALVDYEKRSREANLRVSPATVYEALMAPRLKKEFSHLSWTDNEALDMIDRLVRVAAARRSSHAPMFTLDDCLKAVDAQWGSSAVDIGVAGSDTERRQQICEKVFQSAMFQRAQGVAAWVFADPHGADVFEARWLAKEVGRAPVEGCAVLAKYAGQLADPEVLKFFVGEPMGMNCLGHAISAACGKNDAPDVLIQALTAGLPAGEGRVSPLQNARPQASALEPKACINAVLDALDKTLAP